MLNKATSEVKKAFTLAEVLITLAIIGVVAAMTIPALTNNIHESQYNVGVKKALSLLSSAVQQIQTNNGGVVEVGSTTDATPFRDDFCSVLNCMKKDTPTNIFGSSIYKYYKGGNYKAMNVSPQQAALLNNGYMLLFNDYGENCKHSSSGNTANICAEIAVDVNGAASPNMYGTDFFSFWVISNNGAYSVIPEGTPNEDSKTCTANSSEYMTSQGCTYTRLYNPNNMP